MFMDLCVSVAIHAFLGNKKDSSSDDQDGTNHIEDRGTDTTGAGKYDIATARQHTLRRPSPCFTALSEERGVYFFASSEMTALKKVYIVITFPCSVVN